MGIKVFIDGAHGTTGLEIRERLKSRPEFDLILLENRQRKNTKLRQEAFLTADIAILCLPDEAAIEAMSLVKSSNTRIIDASSAHRISDGWIYGFPEIIGHQRISEAKFVSNPGCYPTGFLTLTVPLMKAKVLARNSRLFCNGISGYSGGGKSLIKRFSEENAPALRSYSLSGMHRHLAEMKKYSGLASAPLFTPTVVPAFRGMIVEVPLLIDQHSGNYCFDDIAANLSEFYKNSPLISVETNTPDEDEIILQKNEMGWDGITVHVLRQKSENQIRLIAKLDNLGKGAAGAAIQNLNIMCGIAETEGLRIKKNYLPKI